MDPNKVLILDNSSKSNDFKTMFNVSITYDDLKLKLTALEVHEIDAFYVHNSSKEMISHDYLGKVMSDIISIKCQDGLTNIIRPRVPNLYLTAVGVVKNKFINLLLDRQEMDSFILKEFSATEILPVHINKIYNNVINKIPQNCSNVIFSFYCYKKSRSLEKYLGHFIQGLTLSEIYEHNADPDRRREKSQELIDINVNEISSILKTLQISEENMASVIYMDNTTVLADVFTFIQRVCKIDTQFSLFKNEQHSVEKSPQFELNKTNIDVEELIKENYKLKRIERALKYKYRKLYKSVQDEKQKSSREVLDKLSTSHNDFIESQRKKYDEIISATKENHDLKMNDMMKYYEECLKLQEKEVEYYKNSNVNLKKDNENLKSTLAIREEKLENIQCLLLDKTSVKTPNKQVVEENNSKIMLPVKKEASVVKEANQHYENQIKNLTEKIEDLEKQVKEKEKIIDNLLCQIKYFKELKASDEKCRKELEADKAELNRNLENMQSRYKEQFKEYEKLLRKSRQEVDVHKREVSKLQQHISSPFINRLRHVSTSKLSRKKLAEDLPSVDPITHQCSAHAEPDTLLAEMSDTSERKSPTSCQKDAPSKTKSPSKTENEFDEESTSSKTSKRPRGRPCNRTSTSLRVKKREKRGKRK